MEDHLTMDRLSTPAHTAARSDSDTNPTVGTTVYGPPPTAGATILSDHQLKSPPEWMTTTRPGSGMALSTEPPTRSDNSTAALNPLPLTTTANVTIHTRRDHGNNAPNTIHDLVQEFRLWRDQDVQQFA